MADKQELRQEYLQKRHMHTDKAPNLQKEKGWVEQLSILTDLITPRSIAAYYPSQGEANPIPFLQSRLLGLDIQVFLPKFIPEQPQPYSLSAWDLQDESLEVGPFGILQPQKYTPAPQDIDMWIVPCVALDVFGHRLGMGGGIYDRLLASTQGVKIGLINDWQLANHIPSDPWDIRMDLIVTPEITYSVVTPTPNE